MSSVYLAFRMAVQQSFQAGNLYEVLEHRHDVFWTLGSEGDVANFLQHAFTIYVPEHPYKNYFNDLYAMRLPIFTPSIEFLSRLWPEVKSLDTLSSYDGWFDRTIPRMRLLLSADLDAVTPEAKLQELPDPFDLSNDGFRKARTWLDSSDYFHFPGVMHFRSIPDLYSQVMSETLEVSLLQARKVMDDFARQRRAEALQYFAGAVGAKRGAVEEKDDTGRSRLWRWGITVSPHILLKRILNSQGYPAFLHWQIHRMMFRCANSNGLIVFNLCWAGSSYFLGGTQ